MEAAVLDPPLVVMDVHFGMAAGLESQSGGQVCPNGAAACQKYRDGRPIRDTGWPLSPIGRAGLSRSRRCPPEVDELVARAL